MRPTLGRSRRKVTTLSGSSGPPSKHLGGAPAVETVPRRLQPLVVEPVQLLLAGGLVAALLAEQAKVGHQPAPRRVEDLLQLRGIDPGGQGLTEGGQGLTEGGQPGPDVDAGIRVPLPRVRCLFRRVRLLLRGRANPRRQFREQGGEGLRRAGAVLRRLGGDPLGVLPVGQQLEDLLRLEPPDAVGLAVLLQGQRGVRVHLSPL